MFDLPPPRHISTLRVSPPPRRGSAIVRKVNEELPVGYICFGSPPPSAHAGRGAVGIKEATMFTTIPAIVGFTNVPWNKGRLVGQKRPLKPQDVWAIRVRLQLKGRTRDLALFNLAIDSKLRGCDLVSLQVEDVCAGGRVRDRGTVIQKKTGRPVQFEITEQTRASIRDWLSKADLRSGRGLFPSRLRGQPHLSTRQYARIVHGWVESAGGWTARPTAPTRCVGRRRPRSIEKPATCERSSCCSGIPSWRAPSATS